MENDNKSDNFLDFFVSKEPEEAIKETMPFMELMMQYKCALKEVQTKLEVLNEEFSIKFNRNPVESIKTRIKRPLSIIAKLKNLNLPFTLESIKENIFDVAGVRIICSFPEDIYSLSQMLAKQDDVKVISIKDYIKNPKENGYRSYHLIIEIPIFLSNRTEHVNVEVQFRTIAMDFWASLEHKLKYKKNIANSEEIAKELKDVAEKINELDFRMQEIRHMIEEEK